MVVVVKATNRSCCLPTLFLPRISGVNARPGKGERVWGVEEWPGHKKQKGQGNGHQAPRHSVGPKRSTCPSSFFGSRTSGGDLWSSSSSFHHVRLHEDVEEGGTFMGRCRHLSLLRGGPRGMLRAAMLLRPRSVTPMILLRLCLRLRLVHFGGSPTYPGQFRV